MFRWFARRQLDAFENTFDYDVSYMRDMLDISRTGFWRFSRMMPLAKHREDVPLEAWYAAKIAGALSEDCGPCTQLVVTMAEKEGVDPTVLRALLDGDDQTMTADAALAWRFARAVLAHDADASALREQIERRWGPRAVLSLAFALVAARLFPTVKYALGHGQACVKVRVGGKEMRPAGHPVPA